MSYVDKYLTEVKTITEQIDHAVIERMIEIILNIRRNNGRLFFLGVGGGAGNASHAVNDFRKIAGIESSLSLAQDGIPAALAAYDYNGVILTTPSLVAQELTIRTLEIVKDIVTKENVTKSLNSPDVSRLQTNFRRLNQAESPPAGVLRGLLQIELKSLTHNARSSPCTAALNEVMAKTNHQSTVLVISNQNHDAEALAFNLQALTIKGNAVISV